MEEKRLTRYERTALVMLICAETIVKDAVKDLHRRMEAKDGWDENAETACGCLKSMVNSVLGTLNEDQMMHLKKTAYDYEIRLKPKLSPMDTNMVLDKETLKTLIDAAQEQCTACVMDAEECRECKLQRILSMLCPMPHWDTVSCPYALAEWEN